MGASVETVGQRIKRLRETRGWNQSEFAQFLGKSRSYVNQIEAEVFKPGADNLPIVAGVLGTTLEYLITGQGNPTLPQRPTPDTTNPPIALFQGIWDAEHLAALEAGWADFTEDERVDFWQRAYQHQENREKILEAQKWMRIVDEAQARLPPLPD